MRQPHGKNNLMLGNMLVLNAGSSSIKAAIFQSGGPDGPNPVASGQLEGLGAHPHVIAKSDQGTVLLDQKWPDNAGPKNYDDALAILLRGLLGNAKDWRPVAVGHRVVHGGPHFKDPVVIDAAVRKQIEDLVPLAVLQQPHNLQGIDAAAKAFPQAKQVACFDTAFHRAHPWVADTYALPRRYYADGIRRYGFHGLSYAYIVRVLRQLFPAVASGRVIVAHLGNGASLCAIRDGKPVDTTMGFTPIDGVPMGTRCGQIDPGVLLYLAGGKGMSIDELSNLLQHQSGLLGLSGLSLDMRDLLKATTTEAKETVDYFVYHVTKAIGGLTAALGGLDGLVFTAGIGEHAAPIRERICKNLQWLGLELDDAANAKNERVISSGKSKVSALVIPTNEERMIAIEMEKIIQLS
jgi:acetate kinase